MKRPSERIEVILAAHLKRSRIITCRFICGLSLSVLLASCSGCMGLFSERFHEPQYDVRGKKLIVVPFSVPGKWYYESAEGTEFSRILAAAMSTDCGQMKILSGPDIDRSIGGAFEEPMPWSAIARRHDADLILIGKIVRIEISNQKIVGALSGKLNFDVSIWDPARDEMGYLRSFEVVYPTAIERGNIVVTFEQTDAEFRRKLFAEAAKQVKRQLCGALEDTYPE